MRAPTKCPYCGANNTIVVQFDNMAAPGKEQKTIITCREIAAKGTKMPARGCGRDYGVAYAVEVNVTTRKFEDQE